MKWLGLTYLAHNTRGFGYAVVTCHVFGPFDADLVGSGRVSSFAVHVDPLPRPLRREVLPLERLLTVLLLPLVHFTWVN